jgi:hypothetical protein
MNDGGNTRAVASDYREYAPPLALATICCVSGRSPSPVAANTRNACSPMAASISFSSTIPPSRRSDANLNFRLSRWTDALRLFVVVYCVSHFVNIILRKEAALFVTTP